MDTVGILVFYNGSWVHNDNIESYEGGEAKGIIVSRNITFSELVDRIYKITNADRNKYIVTLKFSVPLSSSAYKHLKVEDNDDVQYFLKYNTDVMSSKVTPLLATLKIIEGHDWVEDVNFECAENIVADFCVPSNEEEAYSTPNVHPHRESNFQASTVQVTQVQSKTPQRSSWTEMHTSRVHLVHGKSVEDIDYGGGLSCINWEANFKVGRVFPNKLALIKTLCLAAVRGHFRFRTVQSGKRRLCVRCWQLPCPWQLRAYKVGLHEFRVVKYDPFHECDLRYLSSHHRQASTGLLSDSVKRRFKDSRTIYTAGDIIKDVRQNFGVTISYSKAWRSRELALKIIRGSAEESYAILPSYCYELERFKSSMRPVIAVDATHLKCKYKGVLFVATAFDGNRNIYPLAFGIGDLETDAAWEWFFTKLHCAIGDCSNLVVISDRNLSIENGLKRVFPEAAHGICFYHLKDNMKASFKLKKWDPILGFFVRAAKSYRLAEFNRYFSMINNERVQTYLVRAGLHKWSRAHCDGRRYNVMTTNIAESINSVLRFSRMLPVVHLIEEIRNMLQNWFYQRRDLSMKCKSMLCPDLGEKKLRKRLDAASRMNVVKINDVEYNVLDGDMNGLVHLQNHSCTCRKFDLEQLPCKHAIAVCRHLKLNSYSFASSYYTRATWAAAYAESIYPVPPQGTWVIPENVQNVNLLPPISKVMPGRRKTQRISSKGEDSRERKCSRCGVKGHYRSTCKEAIPVTNKKKII
ncbi:uncharacterized protein LOC110756023 [Prunus avium]|uniref:Uncharacterized protein LOC110756023 n=1 Tax=Prunus avium TaxID=42229 RepID=A0A6P5S7V4_PRUAV|nr:uncharacterized protein LOC110756023 [Prunus avium]